MTKKLEVVVLREGWKDSLISDAGTLAIVTIPIGLGVYLDSAAMQWFGFIVAMVSVFGRAVAKTRDGRMSPDEAIAHLNGIKEREGK